MIDYPMGIRADVSVETASALLTDLLGLPCRDGVFYGRALQCSLRAATTVPLASVYEEVLGAPATLQVYWLLDHKAEDPEWWHEARKTMVLVAVALAERLDADAVLTLGFEQVLFTRLDGMLTLHDWFPEFSEPEVVASLPTHRLTADPGCL